MRYTAMIVGFLLATLTQVGAAEIGQSDYVEFTVHDLAKTKTFYSEVFGWSFADYGPTYASFEDGKIGGGFTTDGTPNPYGPLMVFYCRQYRNSVAESESRGRNDPQAAFRIPWRAPLPLPRPRWLRSRAMVAEVRTVQFDEILKELRQAMRSL